MEIEKFGKSYPRLFERVTSISDIGANFGTVRGGGTAKPRRSGEHGCSRSQPKRGPKSWPNVPFNGASHGLPLAPFSGD